MTLSFLKGLSVAVIAAVYLFLAAAEGLNMSDPRLVAGGYVLQGVIAVLVGWAIKRLGEVHVLVNSRSAKQDEKIAGLETTIAGMNGQLQTMAVTLATERALSKPKEAS